MELPPGILGDGPGGFGDGKAIALDRLLKLLPRLRATLPLREALLRGSQNDAARQWDRSRIYSTLGTRVLAAADVEAVVRRVAGEEAEQLERMLRELGRALEAKARGADDEATEALLDAGASLIDRERHHEAAALLEIARQEVGHLTDDLLAAQVHRHLAKAHWLLGNLERAADLYQRARGIFKEAGVRSQEVVVLQGLGNVRAAQGRWADAQAHYQVALDLCPPEDALLRGQTFNNLSQVTRRQGRLEEAATWQRRAEEMWSAVEAHDDHVVAYNNAGMLHLARGDLDGARQALLDGLAMAATDLHRTGLLTHLAHVELESGQLGLAEGVAREAEEFAVLCGAVDYLIEIYMVLGMVMRERGDDQGVAFFESALDLARDGHFPLAEAVAHLEYGRLRRMMGDGEEARAHFLQARDICQELGSEVELRIVEAELER